MTDWNYTSIQTANPTRLLVPHKEWVTVNGYTTINEDTFHQYDDHDSIDINTNGFWSFNASLRWAKKSRGQRVARFVRDGYDNFGTKDTDATAGRDFINLVYSTHIHKGVKISMEVWQDSGRPLALEFAQLKAFLIRER